MELAVVTEPESSVRVGPAEGVCRMGQALEGLRVVDLSSSLAGAVATMLLADYGADVVKVEPPEGDALRASPASLVWYRGKKSICADLDGDDGRARLDRLVRWADVLVETPSPGSTAALVVAELAKGNPSLVHCQITAYGAEGRYADRPPHDALVQARTGLHYEQPGWRPGPIFLNSPLPSYGAAVLAAIGISAALYERGNSELGQRVDTSLLQGVLAWTTMPWNRVEIPGPAYWSTHRAECRDVEVTPAYQSGDGRWLHPMPEVVPAVLEELGLDATALAPAGATCDGARRFRKELQALLLQRPQDQWLEVFWKKDLRCQPVLSAAQAFEHPQVVANGIVADVDVPGIGPVRQFAHPYQLAGFSVTDPTPPPEVGQHNSQLDQLTSAGWAGQREMARSTGLGPLAGVRVLDFGLALAGPYGPMLLADLGADVIRVENARGRRPAGGGETAGPVPLTAEQVALSANQVWTACQRGKRSISIDMKSPEGREVAQKLIVGADVVHHNMRPGAAERLGIGYEDAKALNPRIVYCHVTGFGPKGPLANFPGCDQMAQALIGLEHEQGAVPNGGDPTWHRLGMTDHLTAMTSVLGVVQALWLRQSSGDPQLVETNILSAGSLLMSHFFVAPEGSPVGPWHLDRAQTGTGPLCRLYETARGWICLACDTEDEWKALLGALEAQNLAGDPRFATSEARGVARAELSAQLEAIFRGKTADEWFSRLDACGVPCELSSDLFNTTWYDDPALRAAGMVAEYQHPTLGLVQQLGLLWKFSRTPGIVTRPPVVPGQHSRRVLAELGYDDDLIQSLILRRVVIAGPFEE